MSSSGLCGWHATPCTWARASGERGERAVSFPPRERARARRVRAAAPAPTPRPRRAPRPPCPARARCRAARSSRSRGRARPRARGSSRCACRRRSRAPRSRARSRLLGGRGAVGVVGGRGRERDGRMAPAPKLRTTLEPEHVVVEAHRAVVAREAEEPPDRAHVVERALAQPDHLDRDLLGRGAADASAPPPAARRPRRRARPTARRRRRASR